MGFFLSLIYLALWYVRPGELWPELAPYQMIFWVGSGGLAVSVLELILKPRLPFRARQFYLMPAFIGAVALSVAAQGWWGGGLKAIESFGPSATVFFLIILNVNSMRRLRAACVLVVLLSLVLAIHGTVAYHFGYMADVLIVQQRSDPNANPEGTEVPARRIRSLGYLNDPNDLAQALVSALPFLALAWRRGRHLRNLLLVIIPASVIAYAFYLSRSRGGAISFLVLALLALRRRLGRFSAALLTVALAAVLLAFDITGGRGFSMDESATGRIDAWSQGLLLWRSNPLFGVGYGNFGDYHERTAHNSFILCFAELGLVGYFFWMALLVVTVLDLSALTRLPEQHELDRDLARWARAVQLALLAFLVSALFLSRTYMLLLYLLLALGAALTEISRNAGKPIAAPAPAAWAPLVASISVISIVFFYLFVKANLLWKT